ncbi:S41 family peptidase [Marinomonas ostreistagni]|uniref:S41 family peptidase n=1 Tax=Marinomonas ostreistagni TaxID=359209 RepID=A0ABS0ZCQ1_9GAMM|nr:S41 family peptidase [Marinomonas ostreistagni]MBJ7551420.1 S41 family peptidase [Marinomonas ostreistagni]
MVVYTRRLLVGLVGAVCLNSVWAASEAEVAPIPLTQIQAFVETFETISAGYVEALDDEAILNKALKGMVSSLDPHSEYLTKDEVETFDEETSGNYAGIGVEVEMVDGQLTVVSPIDNSPAAKAGIQAGDVIIRIDDQLVSGTNLQDIITLMRGKKGTAVLLDIDRDGEIKQFSVKRAEIEDSSLTSEWLGSDIAYIRVSQFLGNSAKDFRKELTSLQSDHAIKGLIIDLRNNPGGVLQSAVGIVDTLIDDGMIVYTDGRHNYSRTEFKATKESTLLPKAPLVVLVNEGSASASEVLAGAIQDHKRGLVLGTETFGKGSVQTVVPLSNGAAVKLTTALYFTPKGRSIQAQGIMPDMVIPQAKIEVEKGRFFIKEAELKGHLSNGTGGEERTSSDVDSKLNELATNDFQLFQAFSVLQSAQQFLAN